MKTMTLLLCLSSPLLAQKLPLPDGTGRVVQLFDLQQLLGPDKAPPAALPVPGLVPPPAQPHASQQIADMLRHFVDPPLGPGDGLEVLGKRWLTVLGSPVQVASAERLLALATARRDAPIVVQVELLQLPDKAFGEHVKARLAQVVRGAQVGYEAVLEAGAAKEFTAALAKVDHDRMEAPQLSVLPLQGAILSMQNQTAYVKDFVCTRVGDTVVADPVVDVVWDGNRTDVCATFLPDGMLGVWCDVTFQEVEKPIATFETKLGLGVGKPATIQMPRVTGTRLQQTVVLGAESLVVLATQKVDGTWVLATVRATPGKGR